MDSLTTFGRGVGTIQYYLTLVAIIVVVGYGIYVIIYKSNKWGWVAIAFGVLVFFISRRRLQRINTNPRFARVAGLDAVVRAAT